ncbi:MAG: hypothetical protein AAB539_04020 [Patescibacteria group bacterium]
MTYSLFEGQNSHILGQLALITALFASIFVIASPMALAAQNLVARTDPATELTESRAVIHGFVDPKGSSDTVRWFEWGETVYMKNSTPHESQGGSASAFALTLTDLKPNKQHFFRAAAFNAAAGVVYGQRQTFYTAPSVPAAWVVTDWPTEVTKESAILHGFVNADASADTQRWFQWGPTAVMQYDTTHTTHGLGSSAYSTSISGLSPRTLYFFRAVAQNAGGLSYGGMYQFTTKANGSVDSTSSGSSGGYSYSNTNSNTSGAGATARPVVSTYTPTNVGYTEATISGFVDSRGDSDTVRWTEWGQTPTFGRTTPIAYLGTSAGSFSATLTGLAPETDYYARVVARNDAGLTPGNTVHFRTSGSATSASAQTPGNNAAAAPIAFTKQASVIGQNATTLNGLAIASTDIRTRGWFEWGNTQTLGFSTPGQDFGAVASRDFSVPLAGLQSGTIYYYRSVVENPYGRSYGPVLSFRTLAISVTPTVTATRPPAPRPSVPIKTVSTPVKTAPKITFTKDVNNLTAEECIYDSCITALSGDRVQYSLVIKNDGKSALQNIVVTDRLSALLEFESAPNGGQYDEEAHALTRTINRIDPGKTERITIALRARDVDHDTIATNRALLEADNIETRSNVTAIIIRSRTAPKIESSIPADQPDNADGAPDANKKAASTTAFIGSVLRDSPTLFGILLLVMATLLAIQTVFLMRNNRRIRSLSASGQTDYWNETLDTAPDDMRVKS